MTSPKTYRPPDDAKVKKATVDLNVKVDRARETAKRAKAETKEAAASAERLIKLAKTTREKIIILREKVPGEFRALVDDVKMSHDEQMGEEEIGRQRVNSALTWNLQLENQLVEAENARRTLQSEHDSYGGGAAGLAQDATNERNERIKAERQLLQQRIYSWLWKLGGGVVVIVFIGLIFLWITGRLALKFAK